MQNISDLVISIMIVVVPVVAGFVTKQILSSKKALDLISVLSPLAEEAVVAIEKLGVTTYLSSEIKKSKAVQYVKEALEKLGFKESDLSTVDDTVEKAFAKMKSDIEKAYPQKSAVEEKAEVDKAKAQLQATKLAAAKKELADAQAAVTALESTATSETASTSTTTSTATK